VSEVVSLRVVGWMLLGGGVGDMRCAFRAPCWLGFRCLWFEHWVERACPEIRLFSSLFHCPWLLFRLLVCFGVVDGSSCGLASLVGCRSVVGLLFCFGLIARFLPWSAVVVCRVSFLFCRRSLCLFSCFRCRSFLFCLLCFLRGLGSYIKC
jgi:hypothetical protein